MILWTGVVQQAVWFREQNLNMAEEVAGIQVIPTISWSTPDSFDWCFDGEPEGGTVAVSSVGCMNSKEKKALFLAGYEEMVRRLQPETIIFYGSVPEECMGNIVRIRAFTDKFNEALCEMRDTDE